MSALRQVIQQKTKAQTAPGSNQGSLQQGVSRVPLSQEQKKQLALIQRRMRKVKNQMDFAEILANFLPVHNLDSLDREMQSLNRQYSSLLHPASPFQAG